MGRRHLTAPAVAGQTDILSHRPVVARPAAQHKEYGYTDFARGGERHKEPSPMGFHPGTMRNGDILAAKGGISAGAKAGQPERGAGSWVKQTGWSLKEDKPSEVQGAKQPTESMIRFKPPPAGFEPRVSLKARHASDSQVDIKNDMAPHHVDYVSNSVSNYAEKTYSKRAPFPKKPSEVALEMGHRPGYQSAATLHHTNKTEHAREMRKAPGAGQAYDSRTHVTPYMIMSGGQEFTHTPYEHHGANRVAKVVALNHKPLPATDHSKYNIINGGQEYTHAPYEHYGAKKSIRSGGDVLANVSVSEAMTWRN